MLSKDQEQQLHDCKKILRTQKAKIIIRSRVEVDRSRWGRSNMWEEGGIVEGKIVGIDDPIDTTGIFYSIYPADGGVKCNITQEATGRKAVERTQNYLLYWEPK
jgi:hypothetical protein